MKLVLLNGSLGAALALLGLMGLFFSPGANAVVGGALRSTSAMGRVGRGSNVAGVAAQHHNIAQAHHSPRVLTPLTNEYSGPEPGPTPDFSPIYYTPGAPVLTGPTAIHILYYGTWTGSQKAIIEDFSSSLSGSPWYNILGSYYFQAQPTGNKVFVSTTGISLGATATDSSYSLGTNIAGSDIPNRLTQAILSGELPNDPTGIYFFLTSPDVHETIRPDLGPGTFCNDYCGYHVSFLIGSTRYYYAFVGNPASCLNKCAVYNFGASPNGDLGVDGMISAFAHELAEAITDPVSDVTALRAWQDVKLNENGDKCAYMYGATQMMPSGAVYNLQMGGRSFLVQQNWAADTQRCENGR